jgi:hypothetical protein
MSTFTQITLLMKKHLVILAPLAFILACCEKSPQDDTTDIYVGGVYSSYTNYISIPYNSSLVISDSVYHFNQLEGVYFSHQPASDQNVFLLSLNDTSSAKPTSVKIELFTPFISPENFFKNGTQEIDTLIIGKTENYSSIYENFYAFNASLTWENVSFENRRFRGKGRVEFKENLMGVLDASTWYPAQVFYFEFK